MSSRTAARVACLAALALATPATGRAAPLPGGTLDPVTIPKFAERLVVPPAMPKSVSDPSVDYQIALRQFEQQVLPAPLPKTTVWGYGSVDHPATFHSPAFTIEARAGRPLKVKWLNQLVGADGRSLPHLFPVDQTLHWANPGGACAGMSAMAQSDCRGTSDEPYVGPVPMSVHLHGGHVESGSDGHPSGWWLPPAAEGEGYAIRGSRFAQASGAPDVAGQAIFRYPNDQRATTLWYHDHTVGMTRVNVYAGPAGFYLLRGGDGDEVGVRGQPRRGTPLPGPAPGVGADPFGRFYEIPIAIQDRSFNADGSLFYPASRTFFDGFGGPYAPATDVAPIWNPEFFGNTLIVNGRTWPYLEVEPRRYRLRLLNGSQSRFLILATDGDALPFWQIGADGGFLAEPVRLPRLLLGPAERADVVVDFSAFQPGDTVTLKNLGPDEPFGGGEPNVDFAPADPDSTGLVMQFRVVPLASVDASAPPDRLKLPKPEKLGNARAVRRVSLNEDSSLQVCVDAAGAPVSCNDPAAAGFFGPTAAKLGTIDPDGMPSARSFMDEVTETPSLGSTEIWEIYNFTEDAHPIHLHLVQFEVVDRQALALDAAGMPVMPVQVAGRPRPPEAWETGRKDTLVVYPGEVARVKAKFDLAGEFMWHCHILEHEDNEMMRPFHVVP